MSDTFENMGVSSCSFWFMNWVVLAPAMLLAASMKNINRTLNPQTWLLGDRLIFWSIDSFLASVFDNCQSKTERRLPARELRWCKDDSLGYFMVGFCILRICIYLYLFHGGFLYLENLSHNNISMSMVKKILRNELCIYNHVAEWKGNGANEARERPLSAIICKHPQRESRHVPNRINVFSYCKQQSSTEKLLFGDLVLLVRFFTRSICRKIDRYNHR